MLCHEIAALRLFLCAHASLFLLQFRTSNFSSPLTRGAKNEALAAATAMRGTPSEETDSDSISLPLALNENAEKKTSLEEVPARGSIELSANTPRMLLPAVGSRWMSLGEAVPLAARRW